MYLNVILTILVIVHITICGCMIYWWKKYGKQLIKSFSNMNSMLTKNSLGDETMDLNKLILDMSKNFGGFKL